ncbi:hypothetical protein [Acrocarpospora corrugata]|uniref:hypothetical protein n=1 Tax=Acrocarpospora corrugata TaxID=35763 RepID=UPI0012D2A3E2|nr:hypothetical protein [Acrocarpospora corrugata]
MPAIAGWLFADLLLAFSIVVLGTQEPPPLPVVEPTVSPSLNPKPTRLALERRYIKVSLRVDPRKGSRSAIGALRRAIKSHPELKDRTAGIVLTFGAVVSGGEDFAKSVNKLLPRVDRELFRDVATRDFQLIGGTDGAVELQIYLFFNK